MNLFFNLNNVVFIDFQYIIDKDAWGSYISKQSVCIYTGMNDVEVNTIKVIETK